MAQPRRKLRKVPGTQRTVTAEETFARAQPVAKSLGVTRLADITGLDRIGIPTYCAVVPRSDDELSVYNGKGLRDIDAKTGALMEAVERQTALHARLPIVEGSFEELRQKYAVLDPRDVKEILAADYSEARTYGWVAGRDLMGGREVLVPAKLAGYLWHDVPHPSCFAFTSTNGMAAGNIREEAICQALCEVIERDAWTLAEVGAHLLPWARQRIADPNNTEAPSDDLELFSCVDLDDDPAVELFARAGLRPVVHDITSDLGIPTLFAAVADEMIPGFPMVHCGLGTHPDARVAARRALTEAAQSRCVDIQGVREDLMPVDAPPSQLNLHTRRVRAVNRQQWYLGQSNVRRRITDLPSASHDDVGEDLDHLLAQLSARGINQVIVIDFTPPDAPFAVVRVMVPGLETWAIAHGPLGPRTMEFWRKHA
jgi:YcaO-like protein with predicted kinase domain